MIKAPRPIRIEGDVAYVPLTKGYEAIIDAADVPLVSGYCWCAQETRRRDGTLGPVYARRNSMHGEKYMHRLLVPSQGDLEVDHADGDGLNNRRSSNLRLATPHQNRCNTGLRSNNTSGVKGVSWHAQRGKWVAQLSAGRGGAYLGLFDDIEAAKAVVEAARKELHGAFARLA